MVWTASSSRTAPTAPSRWSTSAAPPTVPGWTVCRGWTTTRSSPPSDPRVAHPLLVRGDAEHDCAGCHPESEENCCTSRPSRISVELHGREVVQELISYWTREVTAR